ncbi:DNA-binding domain-containing protein [Chryseolinea soli]|uniref:DUF4469 domain-containing protein n=1 Tax=Chryseolinea soli TaxID=2321403 RepID=A0A385SZ90_9BACT|nr:DNA-binding domain-containing protein [Chryseolinea soli]AYB34068.1 DUF4469 domain-containing protein [Chryseolinea soli]
MIRYSLVENNLTPDPDDHVAGVQPIGTKTMEQVVDMMISRGSTVTKAEALSVFEELTLAMVQVVRDGYNVVTPLFNASVSIVGVFTNANDVFNPSRHELKVRIKPGLRMKEAVNKMKVEKVATVKPMPVLQSFKDITSATESDVLTPGGVGQIMGTNLKFNSAEATQGVFFTGSNGTTIKAETIVSNMPSEVIFVIPATLTAGTYSISVRSVLKNTKDLREGFLIDDVTVK